MNLFYNDDIIITEENARRLVKGLGNITSEHAIMRDAYIGHVEETVTLKETPEGYVIGIADLDFPLEEYGLLDM